MKKQLTPWVLLLAAGLQLTSVFASTNSDSMWRPRFATPAVVALDSAANRQFTAEVKASSTATSWMAYLINDLATWQCTIISANYSSANVNRDTQAGWKVVISVPATCSPELFTLKVTCNEYACVQSNAVSVIPTFNATFYALHVTDEQIVNESPHHTPSGQWYSGSSGSQEQLYWAVGVYNLINPRFTIVTGDQVDYNGCIDGSNYNNWANWGYVSDIDANHRNFTTQDKWDISTRLEKDYLQAHLGNIRVPFMLCPGNHDVPPTTLSWHNNGILNYETNFGQRSWSITMGNFYVLMHDWSDSALKTWANNDYTAALNNGNIKYRLIGEHSMGDQDIQPSNVSLILVGHGHTTATIQSTPYYIYEDTASFYWGGCGFFKFNWTGSTWTCDQTAAARTSSDYWPLYTDNGAVNKVRCSAADPYYVTSTSVTITNDLPRNFFDGRVRFVLAQGNYSTCTNGTILSQYDVNGGTQTAVLVKVNIPANGTIKVSMGPAAPTNPFSSTMKITLSGYNKGTTLTDFPLLVKLSTGISGFAYSQFASSAGNDLRFYDSSGNMLNHEIDTWNTSGTSYIWVRVPVVNSTASYIQAYWGNPALTGVTNFTTNGASWYNFSQVLHLDESALPYADSSMGNHSATAGTAPTMTTSGMIANGQTFNGTSQYLGPANPINLANAFSLSAWIKLDPTATNIQAIMANKAGGWNANGVAFYVNTYNTADGKLLLETGDGVNGLTASSTAGAVSFGAWHHVFAFADRASGIAKLYVDGADLTSSGALCTTCGNNALFNIGRLTNGNSYFKGTMDEARIECTRPADWIWASWSTVANNATFESYSSVTAPMQGLALKAQMPAQQAPQLATASTGGGLRLNWADNSVAFALYTATNLTPPIQWTLATNEVSMVNGQWQADMPTNNIGTRFYRLQSQ